MMRRCSNAQSFSQDKGGDCRDKFSVKFQLGLFWAGSAQTGGYDEEDSSLFYQQRDILQPNDGEALTEDCDRSEDDVCNDR